MLDRFSKFIAYFLIGAAAITSANASINGGRIINGINAQNAHDFAVRVHSVIDQASQTAYLSTGVAVSETVVVTVAQAISSYSIWFVFWGGVVRDDQEFQQSTNAVAHSGYNSTNLNNNIGVIILNTRLTNHIGIASPAATIGTYQVFGYGFNAQNVLPDILQTIAFTTISNEACATIYGSNLITDNNFCGVATQGNSQTANGDQGGPLIPLFLEPQLSGIVSFWGRDATFPVVFERAHAYADFLNQFL